jgi:ABC-2 type transport system ATP-binding protein
MWGMSDDVAVLVEDLAKFYGSRRGIEGLNLDVPVGEVMGFLGPNGAGKTTTIRLLLDFLRPTRGQATVLGLDPRRDKAVLHRQIGYLPGELSFPGREPRVRPAAVPQPRSRRHRHLPR